jgi:hypothetical protein
MSNRGVEVTVDVDLDDIVMHIKDYYEPQDVFKSKELEDWALNNGFIRDEEK